MFQTGKTAPVFVSSVGEISKNSYLKYIFLNHAGTSSFMKYVNFILLSVCTTQTWPFYRCRYGREGGTAFRYSHVDSGAAMSYRWMPKAIFCGIQTTRNANHTRSKIFELAKGKKQVSKSFFFFDHLIGVWYEPPGFIFKRVRYRHSTLD